MRNTIQPSEKVSVQVPEQFSVYADDYHEFAEMVGVLQKTVRLFYSYKEVDSDREGKYMAFFSLNKSIHNNVAA